MVVPLPGDTFLIELSGTFRTTSVSSDFAGFEAAELKVIVAKWRITITNQTMHFITLHICYVSLWGQVFCVSLRSHYEQSETTHTWRKKKAHISFDTKEEAVFLLRYYFFSFFFNHTMRSIIPGVPRSPPPPPRRKPEEVCASVFVGGTFHTRHIPVVLTGQQQVNQSHSARR